MYKELMCIHYADSKRIVMRLIQWRNYGLKIGGGGSKRGKAKKYKKKIFSIKPKLLIFMLF